jgi:GNAT superfamily N-acetyltransferase
LRAEYRIITDAEFDLLWDRNIAADPHEPMWPIWRQRFRERIDKGQAITFGVILDGDPVGEGTLEMRTGKDPRLCNGCDTAYLSALRIYKAHEGQGHISRLVKTIEDHARDLGFTRMTIGAEASDARNLGIYLHWGYTEFVMSEGEDRELTLYYAKKL